MRRGLVFGVAGVALLAAVYTYVTADTDISLLNSNSPICIGWRCCCARRKPTARSVADGATLDPNMFAGRVKQAYKFAGEKPALLTQLWCYCGCDKTDGHRSLLDCYRDHHGSRCAICTGEALLAQRMSEQSSPVEQIRDALRERYGAGD